MLRPLSARLEAILALTDPCKLAADVGTDHGLLAARLIQSGLAKTVLCTDLSAPSLDKAKKTFEKAGLVAFARFLEGDGLKPLAGYDPELVIVAGLGGDTICRILNESPEFVPNRTFLLQPMSGHETLRAYFDAHGFCVQEERLVAENRRIYPVCKVRYDGVVRKSDPLALYCGARNLTRTDEVTRAYLCRVRAHLKRATRHESALESVVRALSDRLADFPQNKEDEHI